jgi:Cu/Ag efflux pump CusA
MRRDARFSVLIALISARTRRRLSSGRSKEIKDIELTLPKGLKIVNTYDRSDLIDPSVDNLKHTLIEELVIVSVVIMIFLWHFPSASFPSLPLR